MKRWWVSWYSPGGDFTLNFPWWISGHAVVDFDDESRDVPTFVAAIEARTEAEAKAIVGRAYDNVPGKIVWRFCNERPADWSPFCDRFPRKAWMRWPMRSEVKP